MYNSNMHTLPLLVSSSSSSNCFCRSIFFSIASCLFFSSLSFLSLFFLTFLSSSSAQSASSLSFSAFSRSAWALAET